MKDIRESMAVIEAAIESRWLNLRDIDEEDAKEFDSHWEAINIVPKLEKDFCINSEDQRNNYLSMIEGMQEVILDDLDKNLFDDLKFKSLAVIQYLLENIKCYPFVLNVNEEIYEWIQEVKIQVEENNE
tara:strand:- start:269 stop:655 length:387 start_codon:yes stop_codon:yes gene_type:complete